MGLSEHTTGMLKSMGITDRFVSTRADNRQNERLCAWAVHGATRSCSYAPTGGHWNDRRSSLSRTEENGRACPYYQHGRACLNP